MLTYEHDIHLYKNQHEKEVYNMGDNLKQNCEQLLAIYEAEEDPKTPYIGIGIWWLKDQIKAM